MANHARYEKASDIRRNVVVGEVFTYWPQAKFASLETGCSASAGTPPSSGHCARTGDDEDKRQE